MTYCNNTTDHPFCHLWPANPHRCQVILNVQRSSSSLSLFGCVVVVLLISILDKFKSITQRLIFWLSVSGLLRSVALLLKNVHETHIAYCRFKGFFHNYFSWAVLLWVCMITVNNFLLIVKRKPYKEFYKWYHAIVWLGSLFWAMVPFFEDAYGQAGIWCWIQHKRYQFTVWYGPMIVLCSCMFAAHLYLLYFVRKSKRKILTRSTEEKKSQKKMRNELEVILVYPLLYILFSIPIFIYRVYNATNPQNRPIYELAIVCVVLTPSLSAVYAIAFVLINTTSERITYSSLRKGFRDVSRKAANYVVNSIHVSSVQHSGVVCNQYATKE